MLMVFDDERCVGQLPIVGCLVMKEKRHIHKASCVLRFSIFNQEPPPNLHAHILFISPWVSTIQLGLDASRGNP